MNRQTMIFKGRRNDVIQLSAKITGRRVHVIQEITTRPSEQDSQDRATVKSSGWIDLVYLLSLKLPNFDKPCEITIPVSNGQQTASRSQHDTPKKIQIHEMQLSGKQLLSLYKLTIDPETTLSLLQSDNRSDGWNDLAVHLTCMHLAQQHFALDKKRTIANHLLSHARRMIANPGLNMGFREKTLHTALHAYARLIKQTTLEEDVLPLVDFAAEEHHPMIRQAALQGLALVYRAAPLPDNEVFGNVNVKLSNLTRDLIASLQTRDPMQINLVGCAYHACVLLQVPILSELTNMIMTNPNIRIPQWRLNQIKDSLALWKEQAPHAIYQHKVLADTITTLKTAL